MSIETDLGKKLPAGTMGSGSSGALGISEQLESISAQLEARLEQGRNTLAECRANVSDCAARALSSADRIVRERPWMAIGLAMAGGILLSALLRGRSGRR